MPLCSQRQQQTTVHGFLKKKILPLISTAGQKWLLKWGRSVRRGTGIVKSTAPLLSSTLASPTVSVPPITTLIELSSNLTSVQSPMHVQPPSTLECMQQLNGWRSLRQDPRPPSSPCLPHQHRPSCSCRSHMPRSTYIYWLCIISISISSIPFWALYLSQCILILILKGPLQLHMFTCSLTSTTYSLYNVFVE